MSTAKNILFFLTDQQHFRSIQENGCPEARTPHMDRLAREGLNFQHHYVTNPVCGPSRGSLWTGRYPSENGLWGNGCRLPAGERTLPMLFNEAGFSTAHAGKLHLEPILSYRAPPDAYGFQHLQLGEGDQFLTHDAYNLWLREQDSSAFFQYYHQMGEQGHGKAYVSNLPEELSHSAWVTGGGLSFLREHKGKDQPFFLSLGYFDPHHAWNPVEPYASRWAYREVSAPHYDPEDNRKKPAHWSDMLNAVDPYHISQLIRSYHAMIEHLDDCLGRLLHGLEEQGTLEDTIVVVTSDHGELLGNHGRFLKGPFLCDDLLRVPLIVWDGSARNVHKGKVDGLTSSLDFFTTLPLLAGLESPSHVGDSLAFLDGDLNLFPEGEREHVISEWRQHPFEEGLTGDILSLRTRDCRYTWYANTGDEEYYEHASDPWEMDNLAVNDESRSRREKLRETLLAFAPEAGAWPEAEALW